MSENRILMFFAPKFDGFGRDVARKLSERCGGARVYGLCTGPRDVMERVSTALSDLEGRYWWLQGESDSWLLTPSSMEILKQMEQECGAGIAGKIITSDRAVGRGFVRNGLLRPTNRVSRSAMKDPTEHAQRYISGLYSFLGNVIEECRPNIVFSYAVASAPIVALAELCRVRKIRFCRLTHSRFGDRYVVDEDAAGRLVRVSRRFERARDGIEPFIPSALEEARIQLREFRDKPVQPDYVNRARPLGLLRESLRFPIHVVKELSRGRWPGLDAERLLFKLWIQWRGIYSGRGRFLTSLSLPFEFIYFPLHVDPEASTMVLSPWHTDQLSIIEALAKATPAHMRVVVKEHEPMLGRRPRGFYRQIASMPRVMLLGPGHSTFNLIKNAELTAVITGTAAWEALLLRKRAVIIGDSPFLPIKEGLVHQTDLSRLHYAIKSALSSPPASDTVLTLYIAAVLTESFDMPSTLLWGNYNAHSNEQRHAASAAVSDAVLKLMEESLPS